MPDTKTVIPDVVDDETLVRVIDELKYRMKAGVPYSKMRADFNLVLNVFIVKWKLDRDPHTFAKMPKEI